MTKKTKFKVGDKVWYWSFSQQKIRKSEVLKIWKDRDFITISGMIAPLSLPINNLYATEEEAREANH